jgi:hypothetical protein
MRSLPRYNPFVRRMSFKKGWIEKHPLGDSPHQFIKLGIPERQTYDLYHRLVGEVAARNAQQRLHMDDRLRRVWPPKWTEDVPRDRQINLYADEP